MLIYTVIDLYTISLTLIIIVYYNQQLIILPYKRKGVSFRAIKNFHFEKNKKMNFAVFLKHHLCCIALNNMKFYTFIKSFIIYLMI